jgi:hypothetical protein
VKENHHLTHQTALPVFKTHDVMQQHQRNLKVAFKKSSTESDSRYMSWQLLGRATVSLSEQ